MKHPIALILLLFCFAACQQDSENLTVTEGEGTLVLSLLSDGVFTELETRAEGTVADFSRYEFTITGTTVGGAAVTDLAVVVGEQGLAKVAAGTYALTAHNREYASRGNGRPYYKGTSETFTIGINETKSLTIDMGKPQNACIRLVYDDSYKALYQDPVVTLSDSERSVTLWTEEDMCYFVVPASGALAYSITAEARPDSKVTDLNATGYVEIQAGCNTTITLKVNPQTGVIIPFFSGDYDDIFD